MNDMVKKNGNIKKEKNDLKSKLSCGEKKLKSFQVLLTTVLNDLNILSDIGKDFKSNLDENLQLLEEVKIKLETYDIELDNLWNFFGLFFIF